MDTSENQQLGGMVEMSAERFRSWNIFRLFAHFGRHFVCLLPNRIYLCPRFHDICKIKNEVRLYSFRGAIC